MSIIPSIEPSKAISASSATLYNISPAIEGEFLTEPFEPTTVVAGTDGVITVIDTAATDGLTAHGTYAGLFYFLAHSETLIFCLVTLLESSNGLVYHASGSLYQESMSCALDLIHSEAACVASISLPDNTILTSFTPTALPVVAVVPISSPSSFATTPSTGSSAVSRSLYKRSMTDICLRHQAKPILLIRAAAAAAAACHTVHLPE